MPPPTPPPNPLVSRLIAVGASAVLAWRRRRRPVARTALPADAEAGQLRWTESSLVLEGERYRVDEGTLVVPENRGRPDGRLIAIPVRRIRTPAPAPGPPLFWLGDGPGASNLAAAPRSWLLAGQDLVIVG